MCSPAIIEKRTTTVQCLSGTGSLRVGAEFIGKHYFQVSLPLSRPHKCVAVNIFGNPIQQLIRAESMPICVIVTDPIVTDVFQLFMQTVIYIPDPTWG